MGRESKRVQNEWDGYGFNGLALHLTTNIPNISSLILSLDFVEQRGVAQVDEHLTSFLRGRVFDPRSPHI